MMERPVWLAYVGCRTTVERQARGQGLGVYEIDARGTWRRVQLVAGLNNPSYLCLDAAGQALYAVHGDFSEVSSFEVDEAGRISKTGTQGTWGQNPVHLALSPSQRWLLVANYATGNVVSLAVGGHGRLGQVACSLNLPGSPGPHLQQRGSHPHQVCFDPAGRWAFVPDKGLDKVFALSLAEDTGTLAIAAESALPAGSGPRHLAFHAPSQTAYVVGELDRTVMACRYDPAHGRLRLMDAVSTVPNGIATGSASGIALSADGQTLHVANRGPGNVCSFDIDPATGGPSAPRWSPTGGRTPRFITLSPDGRQLLAANEDSDTIASAELSAALPVPLFETVAATGSPVCIVFRKIRP